MGLKPLSKASILWLKITIFSVLIRGMMPHQGKPKTAPFLEAKNTGVGGRSALPTLARALAGKYAKTTPKPAKKVNKLTDKRYFIDFL
jgi:hypothetical protein